MAEPIAGSEPKAHLQNLRSAFLSLVGVPLLQSPPLLRHDTSVALTLVHCYSCLTVCQFFLYRISLILAPYAHNSTKRLEQMPLELSATRRAEISGLIKLLCQMLAATIWRIKVGLDFELTILAAAATVVPRV